MIVNRGLLSVLFLAGLVAITAGCPGGDGSSRPPRARTNTGDSLGGTILYDNAMEGFFHLHDHIPTDLGRPVAVVNSSKTLDQEHARATVIDDPREPGEQYTCLQVRAENTKFMTAPDEADRVRPGDFVRFYIDRNEFGQETHREFTVVAVLNDFTLAVAADFGGPIWTPFRLEVWRHTTGEIARTRDALQRWVETGVPKLAWEPIPERKVLDGVIESLNQWVQSESDDGGWRLDPLIETLPEELRELRVIQTLGANRFDSFDGQLLQETAWLRSVAEFAVGSELRDLDRATRLFDWTIRNIDLHTNTDARFFPRRPWHVLALAEGTAEHRAWVFILLARQLNLDVVMLAIDSEGGLTPWLPALLHDGELYLFDCTLGLPIPAPDGEGIATLSQAAADGRVLRQLDIGESQRYPFQASDLERVVAWIEASPQYIARRTRMIERKLPSFFERRSQSTDRELAGAHVIRFSFEPAALARRLQGRAGVSDVGLWPLPYETLVAQTEFSREIRAEVARQFSPFALVPPLWKGRVLHLNGIFDTIEDEDIQGAKMFYLGARPSQVQLETIQKSFQRLPSEMSPYHETKLNASYWLGLIMFETEQHDIAKQYFKERCLELFPDSFRKEGATYNLARSLEALGAFEQASEYYKSAEGPQRHGNLLRARRLDESEPPSAHETRDSAGG